MDYKESHVFPSGVKIDYYATPDEDYQREMNAVSSQEELAAFVERWRYLFPEIVFESLSFDRLKSLRGNIDLQNEYVEKAQTDKSCAAHLNLLVPPTLLFYTIKARKYGVCAGVVVLQLWNANCFSQSEEGIWTLQLKSPPA